MDDDRGTSRQPADPATRSGPILSAGAEPSPVQRATPKQASNDGGIEVGQGLVLAGIGTRVGAFLVDVFVLGALAITITLVAVGVIPDRPTRDLIAATLVAILGVAYFAIAWTSAWAATPGQRLARLRVVDAGSLERIDGRRAVVRSLTLGSALSLLSFPAALSRYIEVIAVVWSMVLLGTALFNPRRQGIHDRWARTLVVKPAGAGSGPLAFGCFLIVLIVLASPFILTTVGGPALQQVIDQLPSAAPS